MGDAHSFEYLLSKGGQVHMGSIVEAIKGKNLALIHSVDKLLETRTPSSVLHRLIGEAACLTKDRSIVLWLMGSRYVKLNATDLDLCTTLISLLRPFSPLPPLLFTLLKYPLPCPSFPEAESLL